MITFMWIGVGLNAENIILESYYSHYASSIKSFSDTNSVPQMSQMFSLAMHYVWWSLRLLEEEFFLSHYRTYKVCFFMSCPNMLVQITLVGELFVTCWASLPISMNLSYMIIKGWSGIENFSTNFAGFEVHLVNLLDMHVEPVVVPHIHITNVAKHDWFS